MEKAEAVPPFELMEIYLRRDKERVMSLKRMPEETTFKTVVMTVGFIGCLMLTGISVPGWADDRAGKEASRSEQEGGGANQAIQDAWIKGKLEGVYLFNEHLSPFSIDTSVDNGVVRLTGEVESEIDKELAGEIAKGIDGVREVDNRLQVDAGGATGQERAAVVRDRNADRNGVREREAQSENKFARWVGDATITAVIKSKLLANDNVSGMNIGVDTQGSRVTLSGEVESEEARQLAEEIAENTEDVEEVENNLKVAGRVADIE